MRAATYRAIAAVAGSRVQASTPKRMEIDEGLDLPGSVAVYMVFDGLDRPAYVGSVTRPADMRGLRSRILEHRREPLKANRWVYLHVLVLDPETPDSEVHRLEGEIGRLLQPYSNRRLPAAPGRGPRP